MDESYGASRHSNTVCGRVRAGKLTQVSLSEGQHGAVAPALVRARIYLSADRFATLLPARRLATPATPPRGGVRRRGLKPYSERNALAVGLGLGWRACAVRVRGRGRKSDLTENARKRQI